MEWLNVVFYGNVGWCRVSKAYPGVSGVYFSKIEIQGVSVMI